MSDIMSLISIQLQKKEMADEWLPRKRDEKLEDFLQRLKPSEVRYNGDITGPWISSGNRPRSV